MRIIIVTLGTEGDVRPFMALATELKAVGHDVSIATFESYFKMIKGHGIDCRRVGNFTIPQVGHYFNIRFLSTLRSTLVNSPGFLEDLWDACQGAEVIIHNVATFPCLYVAEKLRIPCFAVFMQPHHPTRAFPDPSVTQGRPRGGISNLVWFHLFDWAHWLYVRKSINRWKRDTLHLPSTPFHETIVKQLERRKHPVLYAYSPLITPKPKEWRVDGIQVTGYWFLDAGNRYDIPQDIANFLKGGEPPVFISVMWNLHRFTRKVLFEIQGLLGRRLVVHDLYSEMRGMASTERILYIKGSVPHEWLFKRISIAVHHGGLGICLNCIRAAVPMVMLPSDTGGNDHRFWIHQMVSAGVGVRYYYKKNRFVETFVQEIQRVLRDPEMKRNVVGLSRKMVSENGLRNATEFILQELGSRKVI